MAMAQTAKLSGTVTGLPNSNKIVLNMVEGNNLVPYDTLTPDKKGAFSTEVKLDEPKLFIMMPQGLTQQPPMTHLMLEPSDRVTITMNYDIKHNFMEVRNTTGSNNLHVYELFNKVLYSNLPQYTSLSEELQLPSTTDSRRRELMEQLDQIVMKQNASIEKVVRDNAGVLMSAFIVTYFENDFENYYELYEMIDNQLGKKYSSNPYVQHISGKVRSTLGPGRMAPEIEMKDMNGVTRRLSDLRGKVVLIDFWASWCRPCRMENPNVVKLYNKYHDKGFDIFSVSLDKGRDEWLRAIKQDGLRWENHVSDLKGWTSSGGATYGVTSIPSTVLVGRDGKIIARNLRGSDLEKKLKELFGE